MRCDLHPKQTIAVDKALAAFAAGHRGFLLGDKMGLKKTGTSLQIDELLPRKHNLSAIVCPAFIAPKWRREIETKTEAKRKYKYVVYTYSELTDPAALANAMRHHYDLIIFDEVHYAKSYTSQRTEATLGRGGLHLAADRLLGMSGTWPPNNVADMFTWFRASENELAANGFESFCREHAEFCERNKFGLQVRGFKNSDKFRALFDPVFIGRKTFAEPGEIPEPVRLEEIVTPAKALERSELEIFGDFIDDADLIEKALETMPSFDRIAEFRKQQGRAKVAPVVEYVLEQREEFPKQIIFCFHEEIAEAIAAKLRARKCRVVVIHGKNTDPEERDAILIAENKEKESFIVATVGALKEGVDAETFDLMIFAENDWRGYVMEQCEGRLRHEAYPRQVRYVRFAFPRGVDKAMSRTVKEKKLVEDKVRGEFA